MNFKIFVIFCGVFVLSNGFVDGSASCLYENHNRYGYTCRLSVSADLPGNTLGIGGIHLPGKTDDVVVTLQKHKIPNLPVLTGGFCEKFKNVDRINIPKSKIKKIEENAFENCKNLQKISLDENEIVELPESLFAENPQLEHVSLMSNNLTTLPDNLFKSNQNLKSLSLMNNKIKFLPENIFKNLTKMTSLLLGNNKIEEVSPSWFEDLVNLRLLFLSQNHIAELPKSTFGSLKSINRLVLAANNLTVIDSDSFGEFNDLQFFDIESNKINAVDDKFFRNTPSLFLFEMVGNSCFSGRLKNVTGIIASGNVAELMTAMKDCFDNFRELKRRESDVATKVDQLPITTVLPSEVQPVDESFPNANQIIKILAELKNEIQALREENRQLKEQQSEILRIVKKL